MRFAVIACLVACPLVLSLGCFGVTNVGVSDGGAGGASASGSTSSSSGSTSSSAGGMGGAGGGMGGAASSSSASSSVASSSSAASSSSSGTGGGPGIMCPTVPNTPKMVLIDGTVVDYCIDSTEVSNANYLAWVLADNPQPNTFNEPPECAGNTTLVPMGGNPPDDDRPVVNVDWCDAYAFCKAHGKRLCGKIGGDANPWTDWNTTGSQWNKACTANGTRPYPYGNTYDTAACNGMDAAIGKTWNVGSTVSCEGAYPGLFDMTGNVWEWEDSCDPSSTLCRRRGGSYTSNAANVTCGIGGTNDRMTPTGNGGFRCCADL